MLAALLNIPRNEAEWAIWSYNNYDCVNQIRDAINTAYNVTLPEYQLDPINFGDIDTWLDNNQQAHVDFTRALGQQSNDLLHVDLNDSNQLQSFVWLNFKELQSACQTLKIGP